jgi:hypothetical protein
MDERRAFRLALDRLNRLQEKYRGYKNVFDIVARATVAIKNVYRDAESCRIDDVLLGMESFGYYHGLSTYGLPEDVLKELANVPWIVKDELSRILQKKCGCRVNWKLEGGRYG